MPAKTCNINLPYRSNLIAKVNKAMKKIHLLLFLTSVPVLASASDEYAKGDSLRQIVINLTVVAVIYLVSAFIIKVIKTLQAARLKNKILEKGVPDELAAALLQPDKNEARDQAIKFFLVLANMAAGFFLVGYFDPSMMVTLGIMSGCLALSFLFYFMYIKRSAY